MDQNCWIVVMVDTSNMGLWFVVGFWFLWGGVGVLTRPTTIDASCRTRPIVWCADIGIQKTPSFCVLQICWASNIADAVSEKKSPVYISSTTRTVMTAKAGHTPATCAWFWSVPLLVACDNVKSGELISVFKRSPHFVTLLLSRGY